MSPGNSDALDQAQRLKPGLILIGWHQRESTNLHIIPRLRALLPNAKIIVLGQFNMHSYEQEALSAGADAFLSNVMLNNKLLSTVRHIFAATPVTSRPMIMPIRPLAMDMMPVF
jgi:DNA-binding NarL/FixJ family response regulator